MGHEVGALLPAGQKWPSGQGSGDSAPVEGQTLPGGHEEQSESCLPPRSTRKVLMGQGTGESTVPAGQ